MTASGLADTRRLLLRQLGVGLGLHRKWRAPAAAAWR